MTQVATASQAAVAEEDIFAQTTLIGSHNKYLEEATEQKRSKPVPWEGYQRSSIIDEKELSLIRHYESSPAAALAEDGLKYIQLFLSLLQKLVRADTVQNMLLVIDNVLANKANFAMFYKLAPNMSSTSLPYAPFIKLLNKDDEFIQLKSAEILIRLIINTEPQPNVEFQEILDWISTQLQNTNQTIVDIAVQLLQNLLSVPVYRLAFYRTNAGVTRLVDIIRQSSTPAQLQYQVVNCLWLMTFEVDIAADLQRKHDVLPVLTEIAKTAIKEKVVRVILSTISNMIAKAPQENMLALMGHKVLNLSENLSGRKWSDTEIVESLEYIKTELGKTVAKLSTWDEYDSEVRSGKLEWSPPHMSEQFWKENAIKLNDKDKELLRILSRLIATSASPLVLAVAAHDIGQYVKYTVNGKKTLEDIGAKTQIMQLMTHPDQSVKYQALMAVQKLMAHAW